MNKLLSLVGYGGITENHKYAVNDLPYVHDELIAAVAYGGKELAKQTEYFERIRATSLTVFNAEILRYLSENAKYTDTLLRFPEGRLTRGSQAFPLIAGQNIEQVYDLATVLQYGIFKPNGIVLYVKGTYKLRVSVRLDFQGIFKGENIFTQEVENMAAASDYVTCLQFDLSSEEYIQKIDSKVQDQLVVEIQIYQDCGIFPQEFIRIDPSIDNKTNHYDVSGGFSQGFSDGFSIGKGLLISETNPLISLRDSTIKFDVDLFISKNADALAFCFAYRVAARLLADKLTGKNLNIFTNTDREVTELHIQQTETSLKQYYKSVCNSLLFDVQSTATPPINLDGKVGFQQGGYIGATMGIDSSYDSSDNAYYGFKL